MTAALLQGCAHRLQSPEDAARSRLAAARARAVARSAPLCTLLGPSGAHPGVYGTDLGFTVAAPGDDKRMWILFGDTWGEAGDACRYAPQDDDDLLAWLPLARPRDLPSSPKQQQPCRVIHYALQSPKDVRTWPRCRVYGQPDGASHTYMPLPMGFLRTPVAAFASQSAVYGIFHRSQPLPCDDRGRCQGTFQCSTDLPKANLGICKLPESAPSGGAGNFCRTDADCMLGSCEPASEGLCLTSMPFKVRTAHGTYTPSWYRDNPLRGLVKVLQIGRMVGPRPGDFLVEAEFPTNRFVNATARTVAHFDPAHPEKNDYRVGHHTLLLWGRPTFAGERGTQSLPFLLYQPLPKAGEPLHFNPHFFAGLDADGIPTWSEDEEDAQPIYGGQPRIVGTEDKPRFDWAAPEFDHVNQMSLAFIPQAQRWIMLYGGDMPDFMLYDEHGDRLAPTYSQPTTGAIHLRHGRHPWGGKAARDAWSAPLPVLTRQDAAHYLACPDGGDEELPGCLLHGDPHGPFTLLGTLLGHATALTPGAFFNVAAQCMVGDATMDILHSMSGNQVGRLYGVNIITPWTTAAAGRVDLYWNVSTWNPYQVILVRTQLRLDQAP